MRVLAQGPERSREPLSPPEPLTRGGLCWASEVPGWRECGGRSLQTGHRQGRVCKEGNDVARGRWSGVQGRWGVGRGIKEVIGRSYGEWRRWAESR